MDHFKHIYRHQAQAYHRMIAAEDADGHFASALVAALPATGLVVDAGTGTGRIPRALAKTGHRVVGFDLHAPMLAEQRRLGGSAAALLAGDLLAIPIKPGCADAVTAGWALGHATAWAGEEWRRDVRTAIGELLRIARPGAPIVIAETLGTGAVKPAPPNEALAEYYAILEREFGFARTALRTDYQFASPAAAAAATGFFFGEDFAAMVRERSWARIPEWTGLWLRKR